MSNSQRLESILSKAKEKEKKYDWLKAADLHEQALHAVGKRDFLRKGGIQERIGHCLSRAAFQAESQEEFKQRMRQSVVAYEKAIEFYGKPSKPRKTARMLRCEAMIAYNGYWLTSEVPNKKRLINECWRLVKKALKGFEKANDALEYGKTYNQLSNSIVFGFCLGWDFQAREKLMAEAVKHGEQTIKFLSAFEDSCELAKAYARTGFYLSVFDYYFLDIHETARNRQKVQDYWQKAKELSEDMTLPQLLYPIFGFQLLLWGEASDKVLTNIKKALEYGRKTRDKFIVGCALDWLAYHIAWSAAAIEDPEEKSRLREAVLQYAEDAKHQYAPISFISPRGDSAWIEAIYAEHYNRLAFYETDLRKKRDLYEKAREAAPEGLKRAEASGYPEVTIYANHTFSLTLVSLAKMETNSQEKKRLLEEALQHRKEAIRITEQLEPFLHWNRGIMQIALAGVKYELAELDKDPETKKSTLQEAILDQENGLNLCIKDIPMFTGESLVYFWNVGFAQYRDGAWLNRLYKLTNNKEHLRKAAKAFAEATESYQKLDLKNRIAECHWKAAQTYDAFEEHLKAADSFNLASNSYKSAAEKIPQLENFYQDHARYMEAWSEIERARHHHKKREYGKAEEFYEKSADLHKSTERWNYLSHNFLALARFEEAEDLSRRDQTEDAEGLFQQAAELFAEAGKSIKAKLEKIEVREEKEMAAELVKASDIRRDYCLGRIALEEAKILDRRGDHAASSRKYGSATERFEKATDAMERESDRQELRPIVYLCRAWQMMTRAEAEASPDLYKEASRLFEEAKDRSVDEIAKMLALGHSRFCMALEAGTRFEDVQDTSLHTLATQNLESAGRCYLRAGFISASEYAEATQKLLDAYLYMHNAKTEADPSRKARFYMMAEKVLQASAGSYLKAKHPEKQEQVSRLLEKVRKEKELALSLTEVLHAPLATSTTATFTTPTPTEEKPIGLERFEHADIQANLIVRVKEVNVGEDVKFKMELVNAGKAPALLVKVDEIMPEGFEIKEVPEIYTVEDSFINMKGKRLNPLKTEDVKMVVKPLSKGMFIIKPRILYIDENGKYRSHEPDPVTITVKELGIKGWIKGER